MVNRNLVAYDPVAEFRALDDWFDRMFGAVSSGQQARNVSTMPVDITEKDGKLLITAQVPGIDPGDLEVTVESNVLNIRGESKHETESNESKVYRREISYGRFSRSIRLPDGLDLSKVDAEFRNGHVMIAIPRLPEVKPEPLKVNVRNAEGVKPIQATSVDTEQQPDANKPKK